MRPVTPVPLTEKGVKKINEYFPPSPIISAPPGMMSVDPQSLLPFTGKSSLFTTTSQAPFTTNNIQGPPGPLTQSIKLPSFTKLVQTELTSQAVSEMVSQVKSNFA